MISVTLCFDAHEWDRIRNAAATLWPGTELDRQLSRSEICRVLTLAGLDRLMNATADDRQRMMRNLGRTLQPPADKVMPALPVAGS